MRRILALFGALTIVLTACQADPVAEKAPNLVRTSPSGDAPVGIFGGELVAAESCDQLLDYYISHALDMVGPYGLEGYGYGLPFDTLVRADTTMAASEASQAPEGVDFTGTNNQVQGVDEADIFKTDGRYLYSVVDGTFRIAEATREGVRLAGSLPLDWWPQSILLSGDSILLVGAVYGDGPVPLYDSVSEVGMPWQSSVVRLMEIGVTNSEEPEIGRVIDFDGSFVAARMVDSTVRITINSSPVGFSWVQPEGSGLRTQRAATMANQALVRNSSIENWLPYYVARGQTTNGSTESGQMLDCNNIMIPTEFSGLGTLSILSFDLSSGLTDWASAGVVASGSTVYATTTATYVATQRWFDWTRSDGNTEATNRTDIHMFDTSAFEPKYVASGRVDGFLLGQFAMDEHDGFLRVASTTVSADIATSESMVTVLETRGKKLVTVGEVGGLGKGEQIYAVRFLGDAGYVVTFRQIDPLYTMDLSDPTKPSVVGELKITGYSAYLHPIGDGLLLGLGQEASADGRIEGTQLSLFDVSDPAHPVRLDHVALDGGWSAAESDHKAFTFMDGLALAPYESWGWIENTDKGSYDNGVVAIRVGSKSLHLESILRAAGDGPVTGSEEHPLDPYLDAPVRTSVIDGRIYTLTRGGIAVHDAGTLARLAYARF